MRGGESFCVFYSYNPPKSQRNWINKEVLEDDSSRVVHHSTYLTVPKEWLGEQFIPFTAFILYHHTALKHHIRRWFLICRHQPCSHKYLLCHSAVFNLYRIYMIFSGMTCRTHTHLRYIIKTIAYVYGKLSCHCYILCREYNLISFFSLPDPGTHAEHGRQFRNQAMSGFCYILSQIGRASCRERV